MLISFSGESGLMASFPRSFIDIHLYTSNSIPFSFLMLLHCKELNLHHCFYFNFRSHGFVQMLCSAEACLNPLDVVLDRMFIV